MITSESPDPTDHAIATPRQDDSKSESQRRANDTLEHTLIACKLYDVLITNSVINILNIAVDIEVIEDVGIRVWLIIVGRLKMRRCNEIGQLVNGW